MMAKWYVQSVDDYDSYSSLIDCEGPFLDWKSALDAAIEEAKRDDDAILIRIENDTINNDGTVRVKYERVFNKKFQHHYKTLHYHDDKLIGEGYDIRYGVSYPTDKYHVKHRYSEGKNIRVSLGAVLIETTPEHRLRWALAPAGTAGL
jgi:hypothetical protein